MIGRYWAGVAMSKIQSVLTVAVALAMAGTLAGALSGCQGGGVGGLGGPRAAAQSSPQVAYAGNGVIEVVATDQRPMRVELVGPSGPIAATVSVHRETIDPNPYGSQVAQAPMISPFVGFGFGSARWSRSTHSGSGVFLGVPPYGFRRPYPYGYPYGSAAAAPPPDGGAMRSTARVTLDDPAAYERQWQTMRVRVRFGDATDASELPAPSPSR
jgi:hypothetical protein